MLTGDTKPTAQAIDRNLGVEVRAVRLPEDKQHIAKELQSRGKVAA